MEAAFFDLERAVLSPATAAAVLGTIRPDQLRSRRAPGRVVWAAGVLAALRAQDNDLARVRDGALGLLRHLDQRRVVDGVRDALTTVVDPAVYQEALDEIAQARATGRRVVVVSALPEEIAVPIGRAVGADDIVASRLEVADGDRYTGRVERWCAGPERALAMGDLAERDGIDLSASTAFAGSVAGVWMLDAVGRATVVNPDRDLARVASARGWDVRAYTRRVRLRERVAMPPPWSIGIGVPVDMAVAAVRRAAPSWPRREPGRSGR